MKTFARFALVALAVLVGGWAVWSNSGRAGETAEPFDSQVSRFDEQGQDSGHGNLLAVQPWLVPGDYANAATLTAKLDAYLSAAGQRRWLNPSTIAVLPEYTGTWLVAANEKRAVYSAESIDTAMTSLVLSHLPAFLSRLATAPEVGDAARWALFTLKSEQMARDYQHVFGTLARKHGIHLVAGSIVLPEPTVEAGALKVRPGGTLYNVSALFGPDGKVVPPLVVKAFPIEDEKPFTSAGKAEAIPVFNTPAGKLAVLVCADSWYPESYDAVRKAGATLVAVPSFTSGNDAWAVRWAGYNGAPMPSDVDRSDVGKLTEGEAWLKYAMTGRAGAGGMPNGVNVFLRGKLWDLGSDGATLRLHGGQPARGELVTGAVLTNVWLP